MIEFITQMDRSIILYVYESMRLPALDAMMVVVTTLGNKGYIWMLLALGFMLNKKTRTVGIVTLSALLLTTVIGEGILKQLVERPRPYVDFPDIQPLIEKLASYSFPSGHTASSFAASMVLGRYLKKYAAVFWSLAVIMGFSRLYLFVHYPSDIVAGALLGVACAAVIITVYEKIFKREQIYGSDA